MRIGVDVSQHQLEWAEIRDRVLFAEEAGFEEFAEAVLPELAA